MKNGGRIRQLLCGALVRTKMLFIRHLGIASCADTTFADLESDRIFTLMPGRTDTVSNHDFYKRKGTNQALKSIHLFII